MSAHKGFFVVIDGIDGCGKSLHSRILNEELLAAGYKTLLTMEPSNGPIGRFITHNILHSEKAAPEIETLLFAADRYDHLHYEILPALDEGRVVISDRYLHSSLAYQGAQGIDLDWIRRVNSFAITPDISIYLDVMADVALRRKRGSLSVMEKLELQQRVRQMFLKLVSLGEMTAVDANGAIGEVKYRILSLSLNALKARGKLPNSSHFDERNNRK